LGKKGFQTIPTAIIGIEITCGYLSALYRYFWSFSPHASYHSIIGIEITCGYLSALYRYFWSFSPHASYHWLYINNQRECCSPGVGKRC